VAALLRYESDDRRIRQSLLFRPELRDCHVSAQS